MSELIKGKRGVPGRPKVSFTGVGVGPTELRDLKLGKEWCLVKVKVGNCASAPKGWALVSPLSGAEEASAGAVKDCMQCGTSGVMAFKIEDMVTLFRDKVFTPLTGVVKPAELKAKRKRVSKRS